MTGLSTTTEGSITNKVFGRVIAAGRSHSTPYMLFDTVSTALSLVTRLRSNLKGYNVLYAANVRPLTDQYGSYYRIISIGTIARAGGIIAQLTDRVRNSDELSVYGPIGDSTPKIAGSVISSSITTVRTLSSALRGQNRMHPLSGVGRVSFALSSIKSAIGVYEGVSELLGRPKVQRVLSAVASRAAAGVARLRAKLPLGDKVSSIDESSTFGRDTYLADNPSEEK